MSGFVARSGQPSKTPSTRDTSNRSGVALPPAEVLFKRTKAPARYEEPQLDPYGAHRWLASRTATLNDAAVSQAYPSSETLRQLRQQNEDQGLSQLARGSSVAAASCLGGGGQGQAEGRRRQAEEPRPPTLPDSDLLKALHAYTSAFYARTSHDGGANDWRSMDETALLALGILVEEAGGEVVRNGGWRALVEGEHEGDMVRKGRDASRSVIAIDGWRKQSGRTRKERATSAGAGSKSASASTFGTRQDASAASAMDNDGRMNKDAGHLSGASDDEDSSEEW